MLLALAGPLLIVASTAIVLHHLWLDLRLTNQHVDLLAFWMPRWCALGEALSAGDIPTWLPYQFGGTPFVSDPQSGWMSVPVMGLFSTLSCERAMGLYMLLQPVLAGLGLYWFLRLERFGRAAATIGGLVLALTIAGSAVVLTMPFSASIAWTTVALAAAAGYLREDEAWRGGLWAALLVFALSQVAAAHLTDGLLMSVIVTGLYMLSVAVRQVGRGERTWRQVAARAAMAFVLFPFLAAVVLLPRLGLIPRTSIGHGYIELTEIANRLQGLNEAPPLAVIGVGPWWGTAFARGPGGYVGALAILALPFALASRKRRALVAVFGGIGLLGWFLNLDVVVRNGFMRRLALTNPLGELWLRSPYRFRYLVLLSFAGLAACGVQAWREREIGREWPAWRHLLLLVPAVAVFVLLPLLDGSPVALYLPFLVGSLYAVPMLVGNPLVARQLPAVVVVLFAVEMTLFGLVGQIDPTGADVPIVLLGRDRDGQIYRQGLGHSFDQLVRPYIVPSEYTTPGPIGRALMARRGDHGRYLAFDTKVARGQRGFLDHQTRDVWPAYQTARGILFGLYDIQGYNPVQLDRYWRLVRASGDLPVFYNAATFTRLDRRVLDLFAVRYLIMREPLPADVLASPIEQEETWTLYELPDPMPRASVVFSVERLSEDAALRRVLDPTFDPRLWAVVEEPVVLGAPPVGTETPPSVVYAEPSPEHVRITVTTDRAALLVVRNPFDDGWRATVDGDATDLLRANYLMTGVRVPAGRHVVELRYRDRWLGAGLVVSILAWVGLFGSVWYLWRRDRLLLAVRAAPAER